MDKFSETFKLGFDWFVNRSCDCKGDETLRLYNTRTGQSIMLMNDEVKTLRHLFMNGLS